MCSDLLEFMGFGSFFRVELTICFLVPQVHSGATGSSPFLVINENKKMRLLPMGVLQNETRDQCDSTSLSEAPHIDMWSEFPLKKWVHVGWEV